MVDTTAPKGSSASALPQGEASAPEVTPEMIEAGIHAYYENAIWGWENPGLGELRKMLAAIYRAMFSHAHLS